MPGSPTNHQHNDHFGFLQPPPVRVMHKAMRVSVEDDNLQYGRSSVVGRTIQPPIPKSSQKSTKTSTTTTAATATAAATTTTAQPPHLQQQRRVISRKVVRCSNTDAVQLKMSQSASILDLRESLGYAIPATKHTLSSRPPSPSVSPVVGKKSLPPPSPSTLKKKSATTTTTTTALKPSQPTTTPIITALSNTASAAKVRTIHP